MTRSLGLIVAIGGLIGLSACASSPATPSPVPLGVWGGDHVTMTVEASRTHFEFDCAHGDVSSPLTTDSRSQFSGAGTFVREHGGPVRVDEAPDTHPAIYAGSAPSDRMALTVRLTDTGDLIGSFTLLHGVQGRIVKCL